MAELRFSRRTVIAAIEVLENSFQKHDDLTRYLLKLDPDLSARCERGYLSNRFTQIIKFFDDEPSLSLDNGELLWNKLVEDAVSLLPSTDPDFLGQTSYLSQNVQQLLRALERDSFMISEGTLRRTLPVDLGLPTIKSEVDRLLEKHAFIVPKGQLEQAIDAHARGNWAGANGQFRPFFEGLLDAIAGRITTSPSTDAPLRRLMAIGFLSRDLNERDFVFGLMKRLHPEGPHPGLSGDEDSTFRFHVVLLTARLLLTRFDTWGTA